jgi:hypothetical protein
MTVLDVATPILDKYAKANKDEALKAYRDQGGDTDRLLNMPMSAIVYEGTNSFIQNAKYRKVADQQNKDRQAQQQALNQQAAQQHDQPQVQDAAGGATTSVGPQADRGTLVTAGAVTSVSKFKDFSMGIRWTERHIVNIIVFIVAVMLIYKYYGKRLSKML